MALVLVAAACGGNADNAGGTAADEVLSAAGAADAEASATAAPVSAVPAITAPATTALSAAVPTAAPPTTALSEAASERAATVSSDDPLELLAAALENSAHRPVRGEMEWSMAGLRLDARFESDGGEGLSMEIGFGQAMLADDAPGFGLELRRVGADAYVRFVLPDAMRGSVAGAPPDGWFTLDAASAAELGLVCPSPLVSAAPDDGVCASLTDYAALIQHLRTAEIVGASDIGDLPTTQVRAELDLAAALDELWGNASGGEGLPLLDGGVMPDFVPDRLLYDFWIDADGLLRRISVDLGSLMEDVIASLGFDDTEDEDPTALLALFETSLVMDLHDYDADIAIEEPLPDEIIGSFSDLMAAGLSAGG